MSALSRASYSYSAGGGGGGGEITSYNRLYGHASPERGTFVKLEVCKREGISRAGVSIQRVKEN